MILQDLLSRLHNVRGEGTQCTACCPAHDDRNASLSIGKGDDGRILLHCHAGCSVDDIVSALGLKLSDLYEKPTAAQDFAPVTQDKPKQQRRVIAKYDYRDNRGQLIAQKLRYEPKQFAWRRPDGCGGWIYNRQGIEIPLYNLDKLQSDHVFVVEGEKDVDTLARLGKEAVCSPDGAGKGKKWVSRYSEALRGAHVAVIQDNDDVGKVFARDVCTALHGVAASVRLIDLREVWPDIPEHGDVSDFVAKWDDDQGAAQLLAGLTESTPEYIAPDDMPKDESGKIDYSKIHCKSVADIDFSKTPHIKFYVDGILAQGLTFMNAFSKVGKSRMEMQMLLAICRGRMFLGRETYKCGVLYLALEDEQVDFEPRMNKFLNGEPQPDNFHYATKDMFDYKPPTLDDDNLLTFIREQIKAFPDIEVVSIDVFGVIRSARQDREDFTMHERRELDKLLKFTAEMGIALIIAHHVSKAGLHQYRNSATGSGAGSYVISGSVHTEIEIALDPDDNKRAKFSVKGRRLPAIQFAIRDEYPFWKLEGDWDAIKFAEDPVVATVKYLVKRYGRWKGSAKELMDVNRETEELPAIDKSINKKTIMKLARQLQSAGIRYIQHPHGSAGTIHEFINAEVFNNFVELESEDCFEELKIDG